MRHINFFAGLAVLTITVSTAYAQMRTYGTGGNAGPGFSGNSSNQPSRGGVMQSTPNGGYSGGGNVIQSTPSSGNSQGNVAQRPAGATPQPNSRPGKVTMTVMPGVIRHDRDDHAGDRDRNFHRRQLLLPVGGSIYYSDEYPYSSESDQQQQTANPQYAEPDAPAPTIFENRPGYTAPPVRAYQPLYQTQDSPGDGGVQRISAVEPQGSTILVFRDGHMIEIGNYVIVHDALYNLAGDSRTHKIMLADLDLDKTIKINKERGYDFKLPKS